MPIQFIAGGYKSVILPHQADVRRLLHIAFDHGYIFEANEIEQEWEKAGKGTWLELPADDEEIWKMLKKQLPPEISGANPQAHWIQKVR